MSRCRLALRNSVAAESRAYRPVLVAFGVVRGANATTNSGEDVEYAAYASVQPSSSGRGIAIPFVAVALYQLLVAAELAISMRRA